MTIDHENHALDQRGRMMLPRTLSCFLAALAALSGNTMLFAAEQDTPISPATLREIRPVEAEIDQIEAETLKRVAAPPSNQVRQIELLGQLLLFDKELSVNRNEARAFCHMREAGSTGPICEINRTTGAHEDVAKKSRGGWRRG